MIYKLLFFINIFFISTFAMEVPLQSVTTLPEIECFQALIVAYKPREKLKEFHASLLSKSLNYGYLIPKEETDTSLLLATLTDTSHYTRLINAKTLRAEALALRLADSKEINEILLLMKQSDQYTFDYLCHPEDMKDTDVRLARYDVSDMEKVLNNPQDERKNKRTHDAR